MHKSFVKFLLPAFIIFIFAFLSFSSAIHGSLTFDEIVYLQEGRNAVLHETFNIDPYNPPFSRDLAIFPYIFQKQFYQDESDMFNNPIFGRMAMIFLGVSLLVSVYFFVRKYIGENEAIFSLILLAFEPNLLANSHYITMDIGLTLFFFVSFCLFIKILKNPTWITSIFFAFSLGFGMATKISFIPYFFLSTAVIIFMKYKKSTLSKLIQHTKLLTFILLIACVAIWSTYFFHTSVVVKPREDNSRVSVKLESFASKHNVAFLAATLTFLEKQPIPLGDYLATLKNNTLRGLHPSSCFFLGKTYASCFWYFMPVNFFLKIPLALFVIFAVSLGVFINKKKKNGVQLLAVIPILIILLSAILLQLSPLVRYILPLLPFLIIFSSLSLSFWMKNTLRKLLLGIILLWYIIGTLSSYPHFISYASELAFGQKQFLLTDSNMDWGQSLPDVQKFVTANPTKRIRFSYFGRDNGDNYGLISNKPYGSYKNSEICEFHAIHPNGISQVVLISATNWYACRYNTNKAFTKSKIKGIIGGSIFMF